MDGLKARLSLRVEDGRGQVTSDEMERANTGSGQAILSLLLAVHLSQA